MSYKCTCIKWDFLIALSALLCSDPFCALLYSAPLLLLSLSSSAIYLLFGSSGLCACVSLWRRRRHRCCGSHAPQT